MGTNPCSSKATGPGISSPEPGRPRMPQETIAASAFSQDVYELLHCLNDLNVRFLIVGGEAVIFYGHIRLTGDIDLFYSGDPRNASRLFDVLDRFWQGNIPGLANSSPLEVKGKIFQFGVPPNRVDLLNDIDGIDFEAAWENRTPVVLEGPQGQFTINYIGIDELIINKRASGRPKDLDDIPFLVEAQKTRIDQ